MTPNVRQVLLDELDFIRASQKPAAVFMSSGVDSHSVLFALLELGVPVTGYSFTLDSHESRDFKYARETCEKFDVPFTPVLLNTDINQLKKFCLYAVKRGAKSKTDFECMWPMVYAMRRMEEHYIISATAADSHFALSKKANMHYKDKVDSYRTGVFKKANTGQKILLRAEAARMGKHYLTPYDTTRMCSELHGYSWDELNKPKQKQPIRSAFPEYFDRIKTTVHTNLQLGDSGIADHFTKLLDTDWNRWNYKSIKGIYNKLVSGEINSI
jgi:tRNA U34 2-thiouridine synthase MnmA/TrmU